MKFYKIINSLGYVLSSQYEESAQRVLGYGGVWCKDHRKAKRFKTITDVKKEIYKMPYPKNTKFLIVRNNEDWKRIYKERKHEL